MKIIAYVFITLFLGVVLKELGFKGARLLTLLAVVSVLGGVAVYVGDLVGMLGDFGEVGEEYTLAILKIVGVGYVFGICSDICTELGEGVLGNAVCMFGRVEIMIISVPFLKTILEKGIELIQ
jgi:stage III sporulation protein AD